MATKAKSPVKSKNFWTGILTILTALGLLIGVQPDPALAHDLSTSAQETMAAFQAKNYFALITIAGNAWNVLHHLFTTYFGNQD